ncbi:copper resistance protein CopZ, partial [Pseudomonas savastanoi pv. glycinea]
LSPERIVSLISEEGYQAQPA